MDQERRPPIDKEHLDPKDRHKPGLIVGTGPGSTGPNRVCGSVPLQPHDPREYCGSSPGGARV
jgi:hypothetical protein